MCKKAKGKRRIVVLGLQLAVEAARLHYLKSETCSYKHALMHGYYANLTCSKVCIVACQCHMIDFHT